MSHEPSSSSPSFQDLLNSRLKKGLKPTSTKFIKPDGTVLLLENQGQNTVPPDVTVPQKVFGFVVDTKPDLSLGQILPWLFISSQDVANDVSLLSQNRITHILSLLPGFELSSMAKPLVKSHLVLDIFDETNFSLQSSEILEAIRFIHDCKTQSKNILVHCNAGLSRAPSVAILYLMQEEGHDFDSAFNLVKCARPKMRPNDGFMKQLKNLDYYFPSDGDDGE